MSLLFVKNVGGVITVPEALHIDADGKITDINGEDHKHLAGLSPEATARITNSACWKLATTPRPSPVPALRKEK